MYVVNVKSTVKISLIFVTFLENTKFNGGLQQIKGSYAKKLSTYQHSLEWNRGNYDTLFGILELFRSE